MNESKNSSLVSVIIPVYKVEAYLSRCVDSVLSQTYRNLEIILVDDGSPDRCGEICDEYAKTDIRIKVIHKENGGVSDARNYGTTHSTGEYLTFIDSDDYVSEDFIEYLITILENNGADISICSVIETNNSHADFTITDGTEEIIIPGKDACLGFHGRKHIYYMATCAKLYKREIAEKYLYPIGRRHEDEATIAKYYYEAEYVAVGNRRLYAYFQNPQGFMSTLSSAKNVDAIWARAHRAMFFEEKKETQLAKAFWKRFFSYCLRDSVEHDDRCYVDIKAYVKLKRLNTKMLFHVPFYLLAPKLYGIFARAHLKRARALD